MSKDFNKSLRQLKTGREILRALKDYGALSTRSLCYILGGANVEKTQSAIYRLVELGLVQSLSYKFEQRMGAYYYFDSRLHKRLLLADLLNCDAEELKTESIKFSELAHEQRCARTQFDLDRMFPQAQTYRDYQLDKHRLNERIFPAMAHERRAFPDITLYFEDKTRKNAECFIAFEIEESLKSKARILEKLSKYATESLLDGVVYISDQTHITSTVSSIFSKPVLDKNLRIKHYGNLFLLFQEQTPKQLGLSHKTFNMDGKEVNLIKWIMFLMSTRNFERRKSQIVVGGDSTSVQM